MTNFLLKLFATLVIGIVAAFIYLFKIILNYSSEEIKPDIIFLLIIFIMAAPLFVYYTRSTIFLGILSLFHKIVRKINKHSDK